MIILHGLILERSSVCVARTDNRQRSLGSEKQLISINSDSNRNEGLGGRHLGGWRWDCESGLSWIMGWVVDSFPETQISGREGRFGWKIRSRLLNAIVEMPVGGELLRTAGVSSGLEHPRRDLHLRLQRPNNNNKKPADGNYPVWAWGQWGGGKTAKDTGQGHTCHGWQRFQTMTKEKGKCRTGKIPIMDLRERECFRKGNFQKGTRVMGCGGWEGLFYQATLRREMSQHWDRLRRVCWACKEEVEVRKQKQEGWL